MKVLVLGGTGLISKAIVRDLHARGDEVYIFNRGLTPAVPPGGVHLVQGDRQDGTLLRELAATGRFDAVIDMICYTAADARVAVRAFSGEVRQYVLCSTVDVYTKPARSYPVDEGHERVPSPAFPYAHQKQIAETIIHSAHEAGAFGLTVLRPAATYARHVVAPLATMDLYVERLRAGQPVILHGDGSSIWAVCHRDDVARAFVATLGNDRAVGNAYNVAGDELLTWDSYWRTFANALGVGEPAFIHVPTDLLRVMAPTLAEWCDLNFQFNNIIDSTAARRDLGFASTVPWSVGAQLVVEGWTPRPVPPALSRSYSDIVEAWQKGSARIAAA